VKALETVTKEAVFRVIATLKMLGFERLGLASSPVGGGVYQRNNIRVVVWWCPETNSTNYPDAPYDVLVGTLHQGREPTRGWAYSCDTGCANEVELMVKLGRALDDERGGTGNS